MDVKSALTCQKGMRLVFTYASSRHIEHLLQQIAEP